jgi:NAD(P)-dependent dehydrogenase (short-subunit alcohol dehydrogenase family)
MNLSGRVAIVTGAARGIGRAIARAYAAEGARVALVDVLADALADAAAEIASAGGRCLAVTADVTEVSEVEVMAARVADQLGGPDILVNNAGTFSTIGPVWEADPEKWFRDVRVNLYGSFLCCRAVVGGMIARGGGYVINVVSSGGVGDPHPYSTSYASSKAGLMRLTEGLAAECREHGVKVFALAPPAIRTAMTEFIMNDPGGRKWRPGFKRIFEEGRDASPELVARLAVDLVSGRADALTGRYFLATRDFQEVVGQTHAILEGDLMTLRLRT